MSDTLKDGSIKTYVDAAVAQLLAASYPVWISAHQLSTGGGGSAAAGQAGSTVNDRVRYYLMDASAAEGVLGNWHVPNFGVATIDIKARWAPTSTAGGNVALRLSYASRAVGETAHGGSITGSTVIAAAPTALNITETTLVSGIAVSPLDLFRFTVERLGADGGDTYGADIGLFGILIERAS